MNTPSEVIQTLKQLQKKYYETAKELVIPTMQSLVQDPIQSYRFNAYTPYFSDGDECIYGLGDIYFKVSNPMAKLSLGMKVNVKAIDAIGEIIEINDNMLSLILHNGKSIVLPITEVSNPDEDEDEDYEGSYKFSGKLKKCASEIESFLLQVPREILKEAVGDHVTVTVFNNNIEIEDYEHD